MLIICTRAVSEWLKVFGLRLGGISMEEGSPLDASFYFSLIAVGVYVLNKRQVRLAEFVRNNGWVTAFLLYCFVAILWSDFPFVSLKRWIKVLGHPIMVLIVFTEPDPAQALRTLMKRCAYVIVPVSIMLIKYYPEIGRNAGPWATASMNNGITGDKNLLGADCLILGLFFFWYLLQVWPSEKGKARRNELLLTVGILIAIAWLVRMAQSSTATISLIVGILTVRLLALRFVNKRIIGAYVLAGILLLVMAQLTFGVFGKIVDFSGHGNTLEGRGELWGKLFEFETNPIFGVGFESFWLGERLAKIGELYWWQANEAHNGYLETYLNLGLIGVFMMIAWIIATFRKGRLELLKNFEYGRFRLGFLAAAVVYNWTESGFKGLHSVWFIFYLISLDYPKLEYESVAQSPETTDPEKEMKFVYAEGKAMEGFSSG
jgi:O-antigen ligase